MRRGFTLVEMLLAVGLLALVTALTFLTFTTVARAWKRGTDMADGIHHGDFVLDNLVMALRSAFYPAGGGPGYGFLLEDNGDGPNASDVISWVKLGSSLVGRHSELADNPHRIRFSIEYGDGGRQAAVRAWRITGQPDDFDPSDVEPAFISGRVTGLDCRCALKIEDGSIEWEDEWKDENTNRLPRFVEITVYLDENGPGSESLELRRIVEMPLHYLSVGK
jgi:prepilin-type N-terminal cleavage/methylation domain-containing protein